MEYREVCEYIRVGGLPPKRSFIHHNNINQSKQSKVKQEQANLKASKHFSLKPLPLPTTATTTTTTTTKMNHAATYNLSHQTGDVYHRNSFPSSTTTIISTPNKKDTRWYRHFLPLDRPTLAPGLIQDPVRPQGRGGLSSEKRN